ncbi:Urea-proton symporter DUR3 [Colletotrichum shisoi]|uniref:Urea-proton symporter DUR3 n=1 Tax=Colletotrichum shisoi TaxID=2078593 RepID=A0A5Q4BAK8_9PEZI|nr:Urea-proton symporter DUR3 [Colletotrichum shisoi]
MASTFLLPLGVVLYTLVGGMKATFLTDYIHTFIIIILCCWLTLEALLSEDIGLIGGFYDLVVAAEEQHVVEGNYKGSVLTITSQQGIFFAIILVVSNVGAVVLMTSAEVTNGLAMPYVAVAVAGKGGDVALLLMTFTAVTSTLSVQILAVSSILTFDIYRVYFNKNAGVLTCHGVVPLIFTIPWREQSGLAAVGSAFLGMGTGLAIWLRSAYVFSGEVTISSTGETLPCSYGTLASLLSPLLYSVIISFIRSDNSNWSNFKQEKLAIDVDKTADNQARAENAKFATAADVSEVPNGNKKRR